MKFANKVSWANLLRKGGTWRTCIVGYLDTLCCSSSTEPLKISTYLSEVSTAYLRQTSITP